MSKATTKRKSAPSTARLPGGLRDRTDALARAFAASSIESARAVTHRVTLAWWSSITTGVRKLVFGELTPFRGRLPSLGPKLDSTADALGVELATMPVHVAVAELGRIYTSMLPGKHREEHGVFYTPSPLVGRLLDQAEAAGHDWSQGKVVDPSCGGGAFLVEAATRMACAMAPAEPAIILKSISDRLRGWELDPFAAWLAQTCVEAILLPLSFESGKRLGKITEERNSLADWTKDEGSFSLVMNNPGFTKVKSTPDLKLRFGRSLHGHPNLYGLFFDLAVHLAQSDHGIIAYLTPASYLGGSYFRSLRRLLATEAPPVSIDMVETRGGVFEGVLQEVVLGVFRRGDEAQAAHCSVIHLEKDAMRIENAGMMTLPADRQAVWFMPRQVDDATLVERMLATPGRLSDWGYGVSTGPLVWNRHKEALHDDYKKGSVPILWSEAIRGQGHLVIKPERKGHTAFYRPNGLFDANVVDKPCLLLQRTTAKEQRRRLISALLPASVIKEHGGVAVENHLNMLAARTRSPAVPLKLVAAFMATAVADRIIRCINASVAMSATEIESMPLPPPEIAVVAMRSKDPEAALRDFYGLKA